MKEVKLGVSYSFEGKYLASMPSNLNVSIKTPPPSPPCPQTARLAIVWKTMYGRMWKIIPQQGFVCKQGCYSRGLGDCHPRRSRYFAINTENCTMRTWSFLLPWVALSSDRGRRIVGSKRCCEGIRGDLAREVEKVWSLQCTCTSAPLFFFWYINPLKLNYKIWNRVPIWILHTSFSIKVDGIFLFCYLVWKGSARCGGWIRGACGVGQRYQWLQGIREPPRQRSGLRPESRGKTLPISVCLITSKTPPSKPSQTLFLVAGTLDPTYIFYLEPTSSDTWKSLF